MTCPYCGKEMEEGYIGSSRRIWWDAEEQRDILDMTDRGFFLTRFSFHLSNIKSNYCEDCELVITNLKDRDSKLRK